MLRPRAARWFEVLAARDDATLVLEALARTGAVELESRAPTDLSAALGQVAPLVAQFGELAARYHAYWPAIEDCRPSPFPEAAEATMQRALAVIRAWAHDAEPLIRTHQRLDTEHTGLLLWQRVLPALTAGALQPAQLAGAGPWLRARLFVLPPGAAPDAVLATDAGAALASRVELDGQWHLLVIGEPDVLRAVEQAVGAHKGRAYDVPDALRADGAWQPALIDTRLAAIAAEQQHNDAALRALLQQHELARALGDANRLQWVLQNVRTLESGELLCWITGWSSDLDGGRLERALEASGTRALLHFAPAPPHRQAPLLLANPRWARPFEIFSRALGMPSATEADPSQLLAIVVPLIFGYMFGDVGQGLVLAAAGAALRRRSPIARLLLVGGLAAAVFGLLFGSVFGEHTLLPALWVRPLDAPLPVLLAPLAGGAVLLTMGLGLQALEARWRGQWRDWLLTDAALVVVYLALLASFFAPQALLVAVAGVLHFCVGHALLARRVQAAAGAVGELIEKTLQIMINTLSFARVGAFALAHAGLSSAVIALMQAADSPWLKALVLLLGNAVVIVLEAMVVSIQTTRLVLFEFFARFMQAQGRAFRPLPAPPSVHQET